MIGLASSVQTEGPVRWASRVKRREGRFPGDRAARERVLQVGWIEVDQHHLGYADGLACGQDAALSLAEDHVRSLLLWGAAGSRSLRGVAMRAARFYLAHPLGSYRRLRGFLRGFEVEARDPAHWDARFWTGASKGHGRAWGLTLCLKVLP